MPSIRLATCVRLPEPDPDEAPLIAALDAAGIDARMAAWDDANEQWDSPVPTVIRSTWNYVHHLEAFLTWADRASKAATLWNPYSVVRWNTNKRYLIDLATLGHPVVPTVFVAKQQHVAIDRVLDERGWSRAVIKPTVSAGSFLTRCFHRDDAFAAQTFLDDLTSEREAMIQTYIPSVESSGERCLVWIDGTLTHSVRKAPRFAGSAEATTGPFPISDDERVLAEAVLSPLAADLIYARVDIVRDLESRPLVMELELVEPSLFLTKGPQALERLVTALRTRLFETNRTSIQPG